jgi:hypothetical protein
MGRRLSTWIHQGRRRGFAVDILALAGIASIDRTLREVDETLVELDRRVDDSKRQARQAGRQLLLASYPLLMMAPLGLLIGIQSRAAIKRNGHASSDPESLPASEADV